MKKNTKSGGFTTIELTVVVMLFAAIAIYMVVSTYQRNQTKIVELQQRAAFLRTDSVVTWDDRTQGTVLGAPKHLVGGFYEVVVIFDNLAGTRGLTAEVSLKAGDRVKTAYVATQCTSDKKGEITYFESVPKIDLASTNVAEGKPREFEDTRSPKG